MIFGFFLSLWFLLIGIVVSIFSHFSANELLIYNTCAFGFLLGYVLSLNAKINRLNQKIDQLIPEKPKPVSTEPFLDSEVKPVVQRPKPKPPRPILSELPAEPTLLDTLYDKAMAWLNDGNLFVRIGIVLFFLGASFLIKLAVDNHVFPIELRLAVLTMGAIALLIFAWKQRELRPTYALLLQGGAVGLLYLIIFAAFRRYELLPSEMAFFLLFVLSILTAVLAVLQDSRSLAFFGFLGGFIAPILTSTDSGNHVALFSYYAILNASILFISWFRAWRSLNLLGFICTYGIAIGWGVLKYDADKFASTEPFVILFFIFYISIAILYAIRQPPKLKGLVDTTLLFGTPAITFGIQATLTKNYEYGIAISAFVFAIVYIGLARIIWQKGGEGFKLLAQVFLALATVFSSLAIPFAFDADTTAGAWALEGAVVFWVGCRQNRLFSRFFGILLQFGAGIFLLYGMPYPEKFIFLNATYMGSFFIVVAGVISLISLTKRENKLTIEQDILPLFHLWTISWWVLGGAYQLVHHLSPQQLASGCMSYGIISVLILYYILKRFSDITQGYGKLYVNLILITFPLLLAYCLLLSLTKIHYPLENGFYWLASLATAYWLLFRYQQPLFDFSLKMAHFTLGLLSFLLIEWQWLWWCEKTWELKGTWLALGFILPILSLLFVINKKRFWPLNTWQTIYSSIIGSLLSIIIILWIISGFFDAGDPDPLPWIPLFNPIDIIILISAFILAEWWLQSPLLILKQYKDKLTYLLALFLFIFANVLLLKILHYWGGVAYNQYALFHSNMVQTWLSIFWTVSGAFLVLYSNSRSSRLLWIAGAGLLAIVVAKLFIVDLDAKGSVERIVSFMFVGLSLMGIGYFAPIPPAKK